MTSAACLTRRSLVAGLGCAVAGSRPLTAAQPLRFGLTPVFLTDDLALLGDLTEYLETAVQNPVELVMRRTYQEVTALLVAGQLDAAWICGYPFVKFRPALKLLGVPVWRGRPLYQSYLIVGRDRQAHTIDDLRGDLHAYSDPDSNSGYLVTRARLLASTDEPDRFFRRTIFTYAHRNVVRAVASGLAQSGSVDGYVLEVMKTVEPDLARKVKPIWRSQWLGFPPVAGPARPANPHATEAAQRALLAMDRNPLGKRILAALELDGFAIQPSSLYDPIARTMASAGLG